MPETARERGRRETGASEYEHLRTKRKERRGNAERATVRDVFVGESRVVLALEFEWTTDAERVEYDLDDDRDVLELEALAESKGFAFEQLGFLEGEPVDAVYTGSGWIPNVPRDYADERAGGSGKRSSATDSRSGRARRSVRTPRLLRRLARTARTMTTTQLLVAVIIVKKLVIVAMLAWLLL